MRMGGVQKNNQPDQNKQKKKKRKIDSDTLVIFTILAVILMIAVLSALLNVDNNAPELSRKIAGKSRQKDSTGSLAVILTCAFVSVFIIVLFVIKKIRDGKRKARLKAEQLEKARRMQEIEKARERVKMAKLDEFLLAGQSELEKRKRDETLLKNSRSKRYQAGRGETGGYVRRDLNEFRDELPELDEDFQRREGFLRRILASIKEFFSGKHNKNE